MIFDRPWLLSGLVLLPVIYFLYVWVGRDIVLVPSILIWKKSSGSSPEGRRARRRADAALVFYLISTAAGVLALAEPVITGRPEPNVVSGSETIEKSEKCVHAANAFVTEQGELFVWLDNSGSSEESVGISAVRSGLERIQVSVKPGRTLRVRLGVLEGRPDKLEIQVVSGTGHERTDVFMRTGGEVYLCPETASCIERALSSISGAEVRRLLGEEGKGGPVIVSGTSAGEVPEGGSAVVNPAASFGPVVIRGRRTAGNVVAEEPDHPMLFGVNVNDIKGMDIADAELPGSARVLVSSDGIPVIALLPGKNGDVLYVGADPCSGTWKDTASFPIFWYNFFSGSVSGYVIADRVSDEKAADGPKGSAEDPETRLAPWFLFMMLLSLSGLWLVRSRGEKRLSAPRPVSE